MKKIILIASGLLLLLSSSSFAGGFYLGAGIGNTFFSQEVEDIQDQALKIDENSTAWKIFGGFPVNEFLHIEGGYRNFGNISTNVLDFFEVESNLNGWDIEAMGRLKIVMVDVFAKAGVMFWNNEVKVFGETVQEESGTDFLWGLGAGVHLGPIGVRLEYESLAVKDIDNLGMVSLSATLGF